MLGPASYTCSGCGGAVTRSDYWCPHCGGCLVGVRCRACGFWGGRDAFIDDHCPRCRSAVAAGAGQRPDLLDRALSCLGAGLVALFRWAVRRLGGGRPALRLVRGDDPDEDRGV